MDYNLGKAKKVRMNRTMQVLSAAVLIVALMTGCSLPKEEKKGETADEETLKTVKVATVTKKQIADPDEIVADVLPSLQMDVIVKVDGEVQEVLKKRGDKVKQGDVLIAVDKSDAAVQKERALLGVKSAEAQLLKAKEDLSNGKTELRNAIKKIQLQLQDTEKQYNKLRNDYDLGLASKIQIEQMETALKNIRMDLEITTKKLDTMEQTNALAPLEVQLQSALLTVKDADKLLGYHDVKAPVSGVVTELPVDVGMTLPRGFRAAHIQQQDPLKVRAELTEAAHKLVEGKTELDLYLPGSKEKWKGKISYLANVVNLQTKAYTLELEVPNEDQKLSSGMRVQIMLNEAKDQEVAAIPTSSVIREGADTYVFVLVDDHVEKRKVELGRLKETYQEVLNGLKVDEQLVISGQHQLKDKEKVREGKK